MTPASMLRLHFTKPHVKYHFSCDVMRFTKNRIQKPNSPNSVRGSWCWERKKLSFLPFQWCSLSPTSTRWVEHRSFWTAVSPPKLTSTNHKKDVGIHVALLVDSKWETAKCSSVRHEWRWFYFSIKPKQMKRKRNPARKSSGKWKEISQLQTVSIPLKTLSCSRLT